jgi:hypothetical protein
MLRYLNYGNNFITIRDKPGTRKLFNSQVLNVIFNTRLLLGTRLNTAFSPGPYTVFGVEFFIRLILGYYNQFSTKTSLLNIINLSINSII